MLAHLAKRAFRGTHTTGAISPYLTAVRRAPMTSRGFFTDGKLKIIKHEEEPSKYEGPPLINPRTPYHVDYEPRRVDRS